MRAKRAPTLADLPDRLSRFRLNDWQEHGDTERAAAEADPDDPQDHRTALVSYAYGRYAEARREWVRANGVNSLDEYLDRRTHRVVQWLAAKEELTE